MFFSFSAIINKLPGVAGVFIAVVGAIVVDSCCCCCVGDVTKVADLSVVVGLTRSHSTDSDFNSGITLICCQLKQKIFFFISKLI